MQFEQARAIALAEFRRRHAPVPEWIEAWATFSGAREGDGWRFWLTAHRARPLDPGYQWEFVGDGPPVVARVDPATGQRRIVIGMTPKDPPIVFFSAYVASGGRIAVDVAEDLEAFDGEDFRWGPTLGAGG